MIVSKRARRMAPSARREQLMDSASALIVQRGLSRCSFDLLSTQARVSLPTIYRYFPRMRDLLKALVEREFEYLNRASLDKFPRDMSYEESVHCATLRAIKYLYERGPIIRRLMSDRSVAALARGRARDARYNLIEYFARRCAEVYGLPSDVATILSTMIVNAPIFSTRALKQNGITARRVAEVWGEFILGGNHAIASQYSTRDRARTD
jgi:AcrR family transcriptional regulator